MKFEPSRNPGSRNPGALRAQNDEIVFTPEPPAGLYLETVSDPARNQISHDQELRPWRPGYQHGRLKIIGSPLEQADRARKKAARRIRELEEASNRPGYAGKLGTEIEKAREAARSASNAYYELLGVGT